jgi:hypothetical protein
VARAIVDGISGFVLIDQILAIAFKLVEAVIQETVFAADRVLGRLWILWLTKGQSWAFLRAITDSKIILITVEHVYNIRGVAFFPTGIAVHTASAVASEVGDRQHLASKLALVYSVFFSAERLTVVLREFLFAGEHLVVLVVFALCAPDVRVKFAIARAQAVVLNTFFCALDAGVLRFVCKGQYWDYEYEAGWCQRWWMHSIIVNWPAIKM